MKYENKTTSYNALFRKILIGADTYIKYFCKNNSIIKNNSELSLHVIVSFCPPVIPALSRNLWYVTLILCVLK
jgi:hypothetical protein